MIELVTTLIDLVRNFIENPVLSIVIYGGVGLIVYSLSIYAQNRNKEDAADEAKDGLV